MDMNCQEAFDAEQVLSQPITETFCRKILSTQLLTKTNRLRVFLWTASCINFFFVKSISSNFVMQHVQIFNMFRSIKNCPTYFLDRF